MDRVKQVYLTFDTDWVDDFILEKTIDLLEEYQAKATFFVTNKSSLIDSLPRDRYEIALHPNFQKSIDSIDVKALMNLKEMYPEAIGTRSHTLLFGSRLLPLLDECDMQYESNTFLFQHLGLQKTQRTKSIQSIPFNWSDDKHIELEHVFDVDTMPDLNNPGLNVFNFHPIHIYLNTDKFARYQEAKAYFNDNRISRFINKNKGAHSLLHDFLERCTTDNVELHCLRSII